MNPVGSAIVGLLFFFFWLLMMGGMVVGYIIFLVAVWRGMRAHEEIARTLKEIATRGRDVAG